MTRPTEPATADRELIERIDRAHKMICDLCTRKREWMLSVPARRDYDPDLVIEDGLQAGREAIARLSALSLEVERLRGALTAIRDRAPEWRNTSAAAAARAALDIPPRASEKRMDLFYGTSGPRDAKITVA